MSFETWLLFCATEAVLCFTPGPAVLLVVSLSLSRGPRSGLGGSLGILVANALYFAISATGLGAVLLASWQVFIVIKWVGAAYLVWLGIRMFVLASSEKTLDEMRKTAKATRLLALATVVLASATVVLAVVSVIR